MEVYMKFAIIGGDLRIVKLAEMLAKENNEVYVFGLEKAILHTKYLKIYFLILKN